MDLMKMATQLFLDKVGAGGLSEDAVTSALSGLLGDGAGNIDIGSIRSKVNGGGLADMAKSCLVMARMAASMHSKLCRCSANQKSAISPRN